MRWLPNSKDVPPEEDEDKKSRDTIESRFRNSHDSVEELPPSMLERVRIFLKDLRTSDAD